jgi:DNA invertase Pin-like site-specific DNA recombinase
MKVAIYARVSTANNGQDPSMQTRELREYAERRGWIVAGEYVDIGISGTKETRPELDRLMADAHRRRFDAVVVWKFDRFARSVSHLLRALETFRAQGIEFVSFSEQLDTSTPAGKMVFTVLGAVADEADCRAARQGHRLEADRCRNGSWGRNDLSRCPGRFQNSGKGFLNPAANGADSTDYTAGSTQMQATRLCVVVAAGIYRVLSAATSSVFTFRARSITWWSIARQRSRRHR